MASPAGRAGFRLIVARVQLWYPLALLSAFRGSRRPTLEKRHSSSSSHPLGRTRLRGVEAFLFNFSNCLSFLLLCVRVCVCVCVYVRARPLKLRVRSSGRGKAGFLSSAIRNGTHWRAHTTAVPARNALLRGATWNFLYSAGPVTRDTCAHTHTNAIRWLSRSSCFPNPRLNDASVAPLH